MKTIQVKSVRIDLNKGEIMNFFDKIKFGRFLKTLSISKVDTLTGLEFEEFIKDFFEYLGYKSSLTAMSGDNGIDVIAKHKQYLIGIQTKLYYNHNVNNKAIQEVYSGKNYYKLDYAMVITNWKLSSPAWDLAKTLGVVVIDRKTLTTMLHNSKKENNTLLNDLINKYSAGK